MLLATVPLIQQQPRTLAALLGWTEALQQMPLARVPIVQAARLAVEV